jgi:hypothetical protein
MCAKPVRHVSARLPAIFTYPTEYSLAMVSTIIVDVVECQKCWISLAATGTNSAICVEGF